MVPFPVPKDKPLGSVGLIDQEVTAPPEFDGVMVGLTFSP